MTRTFREKIRCPKCRHEHTIETDFERWMRNCPALDSRESGIVRFDIDILLHKYKTGISDGKGTRDIQCMMFVEVKTFMADMTPEQRDTLAMLNDVLRNRRPNIHGHPRRQVNGQVSRAYSHMLGRDVAIRLYGGHLLQIDKSQPEPLTSILWDYKPITYEMLLELLQFQRDPDRPERLLDHRRRSKNWTESPRLF